MTRSTLYFGNSGTIAYQGHAGFSVDRQYDIIQGLGILGVSGLRLLPTFIAILVPYSLFRIPILVLATVIVIFLKAPWNGDTEGDRFTGFFLELRSMR